MSKAYDPCAVGLHVCGIDRDEVVFFTRLNIPMPCASAARYAFDRARTECAAGPGEPTDFIVDLNIGQHERQVADFAISHQMLARLEALFQREEA